MALAVAVAGCATDPPSAVVGVVVDGCGARTVGSGVVVERDLVLTTAHTLRGATSVTIEVDGRPHDGRIVGFDPDLDLAYVSAALDRSVGLLPIADVNESDIATARPTAWAVRDGAVVPVEVDVVRHIRLVTEDIYVEGETTRPAYELTAEIRPGDSGGPVVVDGEVIGVLWARSRQSTDVAYAIDVAAGSSRIDAQRASGDLGDVDTDRCG